MGANNVVVKSTLSFRLEGDAVPGFAADLQRPAVRVEAAQGYKASADPTDPTNFRFFGTNSNAADVRRRRAMFDDMPEVGEAADPARSPPADSAIILPMWTKMMSGPRKKAPKTIAVIDPDRCFGAFACSICQAACPVAGCIVEEPDRDGRMVCAVRVDLCIGCGLCVTLGNPTAPQQREFGCPADYDAINMHPYEEVVRVDAGERTACA